MSKCRITVVKKDLYADLIARYCDPATVPCEVFEVGDEFLVDRESFFNLRFQKSFCSEASKIKSAAASTLYPASVQQFLICTRLNCWNVSVTFSTIFGWAASKIGRLVLLSSGCVAVQRTTVVLATSLRKLTAPLNKEILLTGMD